MNSFTIPISFKINPQLLHQLRKLCDREQVSKSQIIRSGLVLLFKQKNIQISNNVFPKDDDQIGGSSW